MRIFFAGLPLSSGLRLFIVILVAIWMAACSAAGPQPTPDVDALVAARLTEVAQQADADADDDADSPEADETPTPQSPDDPANAETADDVATCRVLTAAVNLRSGPDLVFTPLAVLQQGTELIPLRINPNGTFMLAQVVGGVEGWISTRPDLVECPPGALQLPVDAGPPTPTPTPTAATTPTPTPTPTQAVAVVIPRAGGGDGDLTGDVVTLPGIFVGSVNHPIFRDYLMFQILVSYPPADQVGDSSDGAGIDFVELFVFDDDTGDLVYETVLESPPYCAFGGGNPCAVISLRPGARWPGTNRAIETGDYSILFNVVPVSEDADGGNWRIEFSIWLQGDQPPTSTGVQATFAEIWRGQDGLVFQVEAFDPDVGGRDGAGIARVIHRIVDPTGSVVYERTENAAAYCAFGGDAPCPAYVLADSDYRWPSGEAVENGFHTLVAIVTTQDGRSRTFEEEIYIDAPATSPTAISPTAASPTAVPPTPTPLTSAPSSGELFVQLAQLDAAQGLVFHVVAYDPTAGTTDGAGIDYVVMRLIGPDGTLLHERTEQGAPYCLFSNATNATTCNVWSFSQNNFRWPSGDTIEPGNYRLTAEVFATSGATRTLNIGMRLQDD